MLLQDYGCYTSFIMGPRLLLIVCPHTGYFIKPDEEHSPASSQEKGQAQEEAGNESKVKAEERNSHNRDSDQQQQEQEQEEEQEQEQLQKEQKEQQHVGDVVKPQQAADGDQPAGQPAVRAARWRRLLAMCAAFLVSGMSHEYILWMCLPDAKFRWKWTVFFTVQVSGHTVLQTLIILPQNTCIHIH